MSRTRLFTAVAALACAAGLGQAATAEAAELLHGVDTQNRLVTFSSATPTAITRIAFTGLPAGEQIVGLDVRPANRQVIALSSASRLYRIDTATGAATAIGTAPFAPALSGTSFGFDFNPTVDRIRLTSDARQNLRLHPDTGATAATDGTLTYAPGDGGASAMPRIVGSAYTNNVAGATTTQLYNLDAGRDALVLQNPPNNGTFVTVGSLAVDIGDNAGFDIASTDGIAYAALQTGTNASSGLYTINLTTGAATLVNRIGGGLQLRALAAAGVAPADTTLPTLTLSRPTASTRITPLANLGVRLNATCSESCTLTARVLYRGRAIATRVAATDLAGSVPLRLVFTTAAKKSLKTQRNVTLTLVVSARDSSGNITSKRVTLRARR